MEPSGAQLAALIDAVQALSTTEAAFALIGGIAVGVHSGTPRATMDVDFAVWSGASRPALVRRLIDAGVF